MTFKRERKKVFPPRYESGTMTERVLLGDAEAKFSGGKPKQLESCETCLGWGQFHSRDDVFTDTSESCMGYCTHPTCMDCQGSGVQTPTPKELAVAKEKADKREADIRAKADKKVKPEDRTPEMIAASRAEANSAVDTQVAEDAAKQDAKASKSTAPAKPRKADTTSASDKADIAAAQDNADARNVKADTSA